MDRLTVIDADAHIREKDEVLRSYLPEIYRDGATRRTLFPADSWDRAMNGRYQKQVFDVPTRIEDMGQDGIDIQVLFPTASMNVGLVRGEPDYVIALCQAYNNMLADIVAEAPDRLRGIALLPVQYPQECARELNRAVSEKGLIAGLLMAQGHGKNLGDSDYWPVYEEAVRLNVPIGVHSNTLGAEGVMRFNQFIAVHTLGFPLELIIQHVGVLYGGIPEKFPDLRICFFEGGAGWPPYWLHRMDGEFEKRGWREAPLLKAKPSEYVKRGNIFYSCDPEEALIPWALSELGDDIILYASDYPHWDMEWPESVHGIMEQPISEAAKRKILSENAQRFYNLKVPARV